MENEFTLIEGNAEYPGKVIRASQILWDILETAATDTPTAFMRSKGIPLTQKEVINAVALAGQHGLFKIFMGEEITLDRPLKVVTYHPPRVASETRQEILGVMFDYRFISTATPDSVRKYVQDGAIDSWGIARKLFSQIRNKIVIE